MSAIRLLALLAIVLWSTVALGESNPPRTRADDVRANPARSDNVNAQNTRARNARTDHAATRLLAVRVADSGSQPGDFRAVQCVDPRRLPPDAIAGCLRRPLDEGLLAAAPQLSSRYRLVGGWTPVTGDATVRYYFYELNLSDPAVAENWRALHRAEREERLNDWWRWPGDRRAYWTWRHDRDDMRRRERLKSTNKRATAAGIEQLEQGDYRRAVLTLTLASELDHGDPACRIHLAQARVAMGHDRDAAKVLRRALQLQPTLVPMQLNLDLHYPEPETFDEQVTALAQRVKSRQDATAEEWFLLGYFEFQRDELDAAHAAFRNAARGLPTDELTRQYLTITRPAAR